MGVSDSSFSAGKISGLLLGLFLFFYFFIFYLQMIEFHSFECLGSIPWGRYTTILFPIPLLIGIWVFFIPLLL